MSFPLHVSYELGLRVGFNGGNDNYQWVIDKDNKSFYVYHTKYPREPEPNIVVIEPCENEADIFYLRTFPGKHPGEMDTEEECKPFMRELERTISSEFEIPGSQLAERLEELVVQLEKR